MHIVRDNILKRYVLEGNNTYETTVIPRALTGQILRMAHDELGHNGTKVHALCSKDVLLKRFKTKC